MRDPIHMLSQEDEPTFEPAPAPVETTATVQPFIKIRVIEGMSSLNVEAPEPVATHLLNEWYLRQRESQDRNMNAAERILQTRTLANGHGDDLGRSN